MREIEKNKLFNQCLSEFQISPAGIRTTYDNAISYAYCDFPLQVKEGKIKRTMVNAIRHEHTNYDEGTRKIKPLKDYRQDDAYYHIYKNYTLQKIQELYPYLGDECERQKTSILMAKRI